MSGRVLGIRIDQIIVLLTLPVVVVLALSAGRKLLEMYALRQEAVVIQAEIDALTARNEALRQQIEYLRSDAYVEKIAREELDLVKPGDVSFVVVYPKSAPEATPTPAGPPAKDTSLPSVPWRDPIASSGR